MPRWLPYECPEDACKAVIKPARELGLSARPWNHKQPRTTDWWLVPPAEESNWPAYRLGKLRFGRDATSAIEAGLHVEKGVSAAAAKATGWPVSMVMTREWLWPVFLRDIASGLVLETVARAAAHSGCEAWLAVYAGVPRVQMDDLKTDWEYVLFAPERELRVVTASGHAKDLRKVRASTNGAELAEALGSVGEFTWVDFHVGVTFATTGTPPDLWSGERLWEQWLTPLARWLQ